MIITIDNKSAEFTNGQTILDAARSIGIDIPTLCCRESGNCRIAPASCQVCIVKINGRQFVPSCAMKAEDGMYVESGTDEIRQLRKTALELLLSEHYGDCAAPCQLACPAGFDIPNVLRAIQEQDWTEAAKFVRQTEVNCDNCKKPCEKVCRRNGLDKPVAVSKVIGGITPNNTQAEGVSPSLETNEKNKWSLKRNKPSKEYLQTMADFAVQLRKTQEHIDNSPGSFSNELFINEANRCLHCDCRGKDKCSLLKYSALYNASPKRFANKQPTAPPVICGKILFEQEKCIRCGVCITVAEKNDEETGLSFIGRGYNIKIGVPFDRPLDAALKHSAEEAAALCPTGALNVIENSGK